MRYSDKTFRSNKILLVFNVKEVKTWMKNDVLISFSVEKRLSQRETMTTYSFQKLFYKFKSTVNLEFDFIKDSITKCQFTKNDVFHTFQVQNWGEQIFVSQLVEIKPNEFEIKLTTIDSGDKNTLQRIKGTHYQRVLSFNLPACSLFDQRKCYPSDLRINIFNDMNQFKVLQIFDAFALTNST